MRFSDIFIITKGTKVILAITFTVSLLAIVFAFFYYRGLNKLEDPRIREARQFLLQYERNTGNTYGFESFPLLDSAMAIFSALPDYASSFETGVIFNNKSSALLLMAMYDSTLSVAERNRLLTLSMLYCDSSIALYERWITDWRGLTPESIAERLHPVMVQNDPAFDGLNFEKVFSRRVKNMVTAQVETPRRLSVSFTNKATIYRHMMKPDSSLIFYERALRLWKDNRTAASNLNVLLGGEPVKPSFIESLFPPDRLKD